MYMRGMLPPMVDNSIDETVVQRAHTIEGARELLAIEDRRPEDVDPDEPTAKRRRQ